MNKSADAYTILADYYERFAAADGYDEWAKFVVSLVKEFSKGKNGADLACGSGFFTRALKLSGFNVFGADISEDMLVKAREKNFEENVNVEYRAQSLQSFKTFEKLHFITVINDGFNYLDDRAFKTALDAIRKGLKKDGVLIFDVSSEYKLKNVLKDNVFAEDYDDVTYLWFNELDGDELKMSLSFFVRDGDMYERFDETHVQYARSVDKIKEALENARFEILKISGGGGEELRYDSDRIVFVAAKR